MISFEPSSYETAFATLVTLLVLLALMLVKGLTLRQLRRLAASGRLDFLSYPEQIVGATRLPFMLGVSLLAGASQLDLTPQHEKWLHYAWIIVLVTQIALWANRFISVAVQRAFEQHRQTNPSGATHLMVAGLVARIVLWSLAALVALDNLGFNITTLMASLGIGGIAVALAVQNILGDIFSSVSIALDKPFVIGDFIVVDGYMGTVEYVGLKTTRIRSLGGEQIVFSNTELLKNRIRNYKRMQERRVLFEFGIAYETPLEEIERIPRMVESIVREREPDTRFDRAHFRSYGESALQFEVVYYVLDPDYNKYMDIQQKINQELLRRFRERGIGFAHPIRTLYVAEAGQQDARALRVADLATSHR
ncbi:MAG TPA: mechanosensitive ion channel family protein [Noviherbaspirillum sp.]|nr:mechanosensitive ion channel family protein [Noviherbaspirillum sp.]